MVKRFISISFVLILVLCFCLPAAAADDFQSDTDTFGFAYNDSKIYFFNKDLDGFALSVEDQILPVTRMYLYVPCTTAPTKMEVYYSFLITTGAIKMSACDYGTIYSNAYHITASLPVPTLLWVGTSTIGGSSARYFSCKSTFNSLPFNDSVSGRYIRMTIDVDTDYATALNLVTYLQKNMTQNMSGVLGNPTYSFSGQLANHNSTAISGSLTEAGYYITGSLKNKYWNGTAVATNTGTLSNGNSGTGGYLYVPSHTISATTGNALTFKTNATDISGSLTPSSVSQNTDLQGTYLDRTYVSTVSMNASRQYDDSQLIQAVNDASDRNHTDITNFSNRNHTDLVNIGNDLQKLVDHQEQVNQAGNNIGSTTTSSTISNTSGNLGSGVSGLNSTLSTASDVSSFVSASTPYISFIGAFLPVILNFGNGVLAWAVVAIIAVTVFLYILKKVSE